MSIYAWMTDDDRYDELGPLALCGDEPTAEDLAGARKTGSAAATADRNRLRPGSRRVPGINDRDFRYVGVIRRADRIVVECGHEHTNRDWSTRENSAVDCARDIIAGAVNPDFAERTAQRRRRAWESLTRSTGFTAPASTITAARITAADDAQAYLAAVATVRALTN
jgi:hypothetical protein